MQLGICPEAASHLQEFKDNLIAISNELIDNVENLSSVQIAKLRQDRCAFTLEVGIISPVTFSYLYISIMFTFFFIMLHYYTWEKEICSISILN